jgi:hypothetical protein
VHSRLVLLSFDLLDSKRRLREEGIIRATLKWYGKVVNVNPCIFNFAVHAFEKLNSIGVNMSGDEYREFQASYEFEEENGYPHFIAGDISCHAGSVAQVIELAFADHACPFD